MRVIAEIHDYRQDPKHRTILLYVAADDSVDAQETFIGEIQGEPHKQERFCKQWYLGMSRDGHYAAGFFIDEIRRGQPKPNS